MRVIVRNKIIKQLNQTKTWVTAQIKEHEKMQRNSRVKRVVKAKNINQDPVTF